jgi:hypothetical protein
LSTLFLQTYTISNKQTHNIQIHISKYTISNQSTNKNKTKQTHFIQFHKSIHKHKQSKQTHQTLSILLTKQTHIQFTQT